MRRTKVKIKKTNDKAVIPTRGSEYAAGMDLYACLNNEVYISPHETILIDTGIAIELPKKTFGAICARSGLATKQGLAPANKIGIIDSDYRGEVKIALHNHSNESRLINHGDRIAQLIVMPYIPIDLIKCSELNKSERGECGFGSTGK